ncbi:MAG TPA: GTPase [Oculatellaceae cyanobacterium]
MNFALFAFVFLFSFSACAQVFLVGLSGVGKTSILNHVAGTDFAVCDDYLACTMSIQSDRERRLFDTVGDAGVGSLNKFLIMQQILEVVESQHSLQAIVVRPFPPHFLYVIISGIQWVKSCSETRLPAGVFDLIKALKNMGFEFRFIIHNTMCMGSCEFCRTPSSLPQLLPIDRLINSEHLKNAIGQPDGRLEMIDWSSLRLKYEALFALSKTPVRLPPNWREIIHRDDAEYVMNQWISGHCDAVIADIQSKLNALDLERKQIDDDSFVISAEVCSSTAMKTVRHVQQTTQRVRVARWCGFKIFGVCVDWHNEYENKIVPEAVDATVPDLDMRKADNDACEKRKADRLVAFPFRKSELETRRLSLKSDPRYANCLAVGGLSRAMRLATVDA